MRDSAVLRGEFTYLRVNSSQKYKTYALIPPEK